MIRLVYTKEIRLNGGHYEVRCFENVGLSGDTGYSSEISFTPCDKVVIDDRNLQRLEEKVSLLLPAMIYSREVSGLLQNENGRENPGEQRKKESVSG